ncbi:MULTISPECIES: pyridoxal-phosphate dependent enzyme [Rhizobium]|nr:MULTISPECIES: pyridoxal-phosphate dependent enzyme [Rhizobium]
METSLFDSIEVIDRKARSSAVTRARSRGIRLPTFSQLAGQSPMPEDIAASLKNVSSDVAQPENLWRVNWFNAPDRKSRGALPDYVVLPKTFTRTEAPVVVLLGSHFPMIAAHKVLPAYACLVTKLVSGRFDPLHHRAIWPSTGNYCRGGVAISRILGCDGIAVLPEGMSKERYQWLAHWVADPSHIIRTIGTESNVKEIYDKCHELAMRPENVILNQFSSFPNYFAHYLCTGSACAAVFSDLQKAPTTRLAAFVSATGSAGTIAAGDFLKDNFGAKIAAVEALECPTLLENGYGEHNIQGIGDKHVPLIHNVMNTDFVIGVSDRSCERMNVLSRGPENRSWLARQLGLEIGDLNFLDYIGISGFANIIASIKLARQMNYGPGDVVMTVATDGAALYYSEAERTLSVNHSRGLSDADRSSFLEECLREELADSVLQTEARDRRRMFNLGYYTWVEQQAISPEDFDARKSQSFWKQAAGLWAEWDELIIDFNRETVGR